MPAEAGVSITVKNARGDLVTLRGDTPGEFFNNAINLLGPEAGTAFAETVANTFRSVLPAVPQAAPVVTEQQAVQNVVQAFPGASTVGQPLPQPQAAQEAQGEVAGGTPPINPATGQPFQKWVPAGVSKKTGKPYQGFWTDK